MVCTRYIRVLCYNSALWVIAQGGGAAAYISGACVAAFTAHSTNFSTIEGSVLHFHPFNSAP
jgi:hypothetical protein